MRVVFLILALYILLMTLIICLMATAKRFNTVSTCDKELRSILSAATHPEARGTTTTPTTTDS